MLTFHSNALCVPMLKYQRSLRFERFQIINEHLRILWRLHNPLTLVCLHLYPMTIKVIIVTLIDNTNAYLLTPTDCVCSYQRLYAL